MSHTSSSITMERRDKDGNTVYVRSLGLKKPTECEHERGFKGFTDKRGIRWQKCQICGLRKKAPLEKHRVEWTSIPQTLKNIMQVAEQVKDRKDFRWQTVQKILENEKSAAWSYYATLTTILDLKQRKKKQEMFIQPKTLKKLVALYQNLNCEDPDWQDIRSTLKSLFGKCSRSTAKRFETVLKHLNAEIPAV